jgi:hypothetical protein
MSYRIRHERDVVPHRYGYTPNRITVKNLAGDEMVLTTDPNDRVFHLKQFIAQEKNTTPYRVKLIKQTDDGHNELSDLHKMIDEDLDLHLFINDPEPPLFTPDVINQHWNDHDNSQYLSYYLCSNPSITPQFIIDNMHLGFEEVHWGALSSNPGIPLNFIAETLANPTYDWKWSYGRILHDFLNLSGGGLSANPNITPQFVLDHLDRDWNWAVLSSNPGMTLNFIEDTLGTYDWHFFSRVGWNTKGGLSGNPNITPKFVLDHLEDGWHWDTLSANPGMTLEFIKARPDLWYVKGLSANPNITPDFVRDIIVTELEQDKNLDDIWDWNVLSANKAMTLEFIKETLHADFYSRLPWKRSGLSRNPNITPEFVIENISADFSWVSLSGNPGIPSDFVRETLNHRLYKWNWIGLSTNPNMI